jgi:hypothetical protein
MALDVLDPDTDAGSPNGARFPELQIVAMQRPS